MGFSRLITGDKRRKMRLYVCRLCRRKQWAEAKPECCGQYMQASGA